MQQVIAPTRITCTPPVQSVDTHLHPTALERPVVSENGGTAIASEDSAGRRHEPGETFDRGRSAEVRCHRMRSRSRRAPAEIIDTPLLPRTSSPITSSPIASTRRFHPLSRTFPDVSTPHRFHLPESVADFRDCPNTAQRQSVDFENLH